MIYFTPYFQLGLGALGIYLGGPFVWIGFLILFVASPLVEIGLRGRRFNERVYGSVAAHVALLLMPVTLTFFMALVFWRALNLESGIETAGLILSAGTMMGAYGITSAHELIHRRAKKLRALGVYNLMMVNFAHWGLEHVFGHHKHVATSLDPATARRGESVYRHWVRNYFGGLQGAYKVSRPRFLGYWFITVAASLAICFIFNLKLMLIWWAVSFVAILLLQTVDYIEHYGLLREQNEKGNYLAFQPRHSWDTESVWTNSTLFNLGMHSHHHLKAALPFEKLVAQTGAQKMPFGYSVMVPIALLPGIYIPFMNSRIESSSASIDSI